MSIKMRAPLKGAQEPKFVFQAVSKKEVSVKFIIDVKSAARAHGVSYHSWHEYLADLHRDCPAYFVDEIGNRIHLNMNVFEADDEKEQNTIRYWFRDQLMPCRIDPKYIRHESFERYRVWATILKAYSPEEARFWGKLKD